MFKQKVAQNDFKKENLPHNRREVFFDRLKTQYSVFVKLGLVLALFFLPLIIVYFVKNYFYWYQTNNNGLNESSYFWTEIIFSIIEIPLFILVSVGASGAFRIIKNLAWEIPVFFKEDFIEGIKKNSKQFIVAFLMFGIFRLLCIYTMNLTNIPILLRYLPSGIVIGILAPIFITSLSIFNLYNAKFKESVVLSLRFFFGKAIYSFGFLLFVLSPLFLILIPNFLITSFVLILVIIFVLPLLLMIWFLYTCYLFDIYMNKKTYPEIYDKGVYRKAEEDAKN